MIDRNTNRMHNPALLLAGLLALLVCSAAAFGLNLDRLSEADRTLHNSILAKLDPMIAGLRGSPALTTLTLERLFNSLDSSEQTYLKGFLSIDPNAVNFKQPYVGLSFGDPNLVPLRQKVTPLQGKPYWLPVQYLPRQVSAQFRLMSDQMHKDIGRRVFVESGFRNSAFQLYLFLSSMRRHNYSVRETVRFVALPGYSEHGMPARQAIDLLTQEGFNVDTPPDRYERSPEFQWLTKNARRFGFVLSYPRNSPTGISYEPWHWHFESALVPKTTSESAVTTADANFPSSASQP
ncbi:MAG: M15 family metallopeptidase [Phycisphaerae bacterium]|nr:M15 family metallopeptidase [Phycisphaerae bacterium]